VASLERQVFVDQSACSQVGIDRLGTYAFRRPADYTLWTTPLVRPVASLSCCSPLPIRRIGMREAVAVTPMSATCVLPCLWAISPIFRAGTGDLFSFPINTKCDEF